MKQTDPARIKTSLLRLDDDDIDGEEEATRHLVDVGNIIPDPGMYRFPTARRYTS